MLDAARALPRVTSFGNEDRMPIAQDFYRAFAPFMNRINRALDWLICALVVLVAMLSVWLVFGKSHTESYVSDGTNACLVDSIEAGQKQ